MNTDDKLRDTLQEWLLSERQYRAGADLIRSRFVVIDRNDLPPIEFDGSTTAGPVPAVRGLYGGFLIWQSIENVASPGGRDQRRHEMLAHVALYEHFKTNPPIVVDEKAVAALTGAIQSATDDALSYEAVDLARRLIADGWKREVTP